MVKIFRATGLIAQPLNSDRSEFSVFYHEIFICA